MRKTLLTILIASLCALPWARGDALFAGTLSDTVTVKPQQPTTNDSLFLTIRTPNHCCCTQYYNKKITVSDSTISLFDSYDERNCQLCDCLVAGSNIVFSTGPISAGKYKIFWSEDMYCPPGQICPAIALVARLTQVGEISVKPGTSIDQLFELKTNKSKSNHSVLSYSGADKKIILKLSKAQNILVTAYIVNGEKSTELSSKKYLPAGIHSFRMDLQRFKSGVVVIHVKGENFSEVRMINLAK